jgi:hypothetical protein
MGADDGVRAAAGDPDDAVILRRVADRSRFTFQPKSIYPFAPPSWNKAKANDARDALFGGVCLMHRFPIHEILTSL